MASEDRPPAGDSRLRPFALHRLLDDLADTAVENTLAVPWGRSYREVRSDTGWVVFATPDEEIAVAPPLPLTAESSEDGFVAAPLLEQLDARPLSAVVLVRLGRYAVGVFRGRELVSSKTEGRYVGSQHKAGGWSQKRFARIREKQVQELFDKVCVTASEKLTPYEAEIERLWLGGDRHVLNGFLERCPWISRFDRRIAGYRLNTPKPDLAGLTRSIEDALSFRVIRRPRDSTAL